MTNTLTPLTQGEQQYLNRVERLLRHVPKDEQRQLADSVAEHLAERPSSDVGYLDLCEEIGSPDDYVKRLLSDNGLADVQRQRFWTGRWVAAAVAFLAVLAFGARYLTVEPEFRNSCSGVRAAEFEVAEAAGATEYGISFRQNGRFGLVTCIFSEEVKGVEILNIKYPDLGHSFSFVGTEQDLSGATHAHVGTAGPFVPFNTIDDTYLRHPTVVMWFEMSGCGNEEGAGTGFSNVWVDYRWRGRTRTKLIELGYHVTIWGGAGCSEGEQETVDQLYSSFHDLYTAHPLFPGFPTDAPDYESLESLGADSNMDAYSLGHNLCRYLWGIEPMVGPSAFHPYDQFEPLPERAVFRMGDNDHAEAIIDAALSGICPEFLDQRDQLIGLLSTP